MNVVCTISYAWTNLLVAHSFWPLVCGEHFCWCYVVCFFQGEYQSEVIFSDVEFHYPSRPDAKILQKLNIKVSQGQTVALVGSSGCGKSTTVQLIERFYDPLAGSVVSIYLWPVMTCIWWNNYDINFSRSLNTFCNHSKLTWIGTSF